MHGAAFHQGRQLKGERLASAGREDGQQRFAFDCRIGRLFLQRFAFVGAELVVAKETFQVAEYVQLAVAVRTALVAAGMPQQADDVFHQWILVEHPRRSDGAVVGGVDQC